MLLLLADGSSYRQSMGSLFVSAEVVSTVKEWFERGRVATVLGTDAEGDSVMPVWVLLPAL